MTDPIDSKTFPGKLIPVAPHKRERIILKGDAMMDSVFANLADPKSEPLLNGDADSLAKWRTWANFRYIGDPTKRLFTGASGFKGGYERQSSDMGALPADQTMIIERVNLVARNMDEFRARDVLQNVTLGLMVNTVYEKLDEIGVPLDECRRSWNVLDTEAKGAQVAARMGFYVLAMIGRKAQETLEDIHGAHLLVQLEGTLTRDVVDAPKEGGAA